MEKVVVVTHLVPGIDGFLFGLNDAIPVAAVIPKPHSIDLTVKTRIAKRLPIFNITRNDINNHSEHALQLLQTAIGTSNFAIIDTGGYFSKLIFSECSILKPHLLGIVEDTENGYQKYMSQFVSSGAPRLPCPIISVARSPLKDPEDFLVGQAVVFSAESVLRAHGHVLAARNAIVLGYGKIGRSIADHLRRRGAVVKVLDIQPARQALALAHGYRSICKRDGLASSELIFCATGNGSLGLDDFPDMRDGAFIFAATSGDDEFQGYDTIIEHCVTTTHPDVVKFVGPKSVYICNSGNSVNFLHGGVVGSFIRLVQGALVYALGSLDKVPLTSISTLTNEDKRIVAAQWMKAFGHSWQI